MSDALSALAGAGIGLLVVLAWTVGANSAILQRVFEGLAAALEQTVFTVVHIFRR